MVSARWGWLGIACVPSTDDRRRDGCREVAAGRGKGSGGGSGEGWYVSVTRICKHEAQFWERYVPLPPFCIGSRLLPS